MDDTCETPSRMLGNRLRRLQLKVKRNILLNPGTQADLSLDRRPENKNPGPGFGPSGHCSPAYYII